MESICTTSCIDKLLQIKFVSYKLKLSAHMRGCVTITCLWGMFQLCFFFTERKTSKVWGLTGISRGVGGFKPKNLLWEGYGYFLEQHIPLACACARTVLMYINMQNQNPHLRNNGVRAKNKKQTKIYTIQKPHV